MPIEYCLAERVNEYVLDVFDPTPRGTTNKYLCQSDQYTERFDARAPHDESPRRVFTAQLST